MEELGVQLDRVGGLGLEAAALLDRDVQEGTAPGGLGGSYFLRGLYWYLFMNVR